ncbi:MAG: hypothetical protein ACK41C_17850 [Phenylobacterium sp.]|jgi:hypothetical protein|uniref:hypothetical protein n=1 Tax=Phenylobacterium sp. TaxID=1871053 RepID=UPI00391D134D
MASVSDRDKRYQLEQNIARYQAQLAQSPDAQKQAMLLQLLSEAEAELRGLEGGGPGSAPGHPTST